jgi:cytoskeletal protein RodZ
MSQGLRDMLANRKFAIPLIVLLAFCLIGLFMIGIVIVFRPGHADEPADVGDPLAMAAESTVIASAEILEPTATPSPTATPTRRPTATLVPVGTATSQSLSTSTVPATAEPVAEVQPTAAATSAQPTAQATDDPAADSELAETGVGWGLVLFSGVGLAALALVARRMRLAS